MKGGTLCPPGMCGDPVVAGKTASLKRGSWKGSDAESSRRGRQGSGAGKVCAWMSAPGQARRHRRGLQLLWVGRPSGLPRSGNRDPGQACGQPAPALPPGLEWALPAGGWRGGGEKGEVSERRSCTPAWPSLSVSSPTGVLSAEMCLPVAPEPGPQRLAPREEAEVGSWPRFPTG